MKASHSHSSPLRLHFVHIGRMSSPGVVSESDRDKEDGEFDNTNGAIGTYISCVCGGNSDIQTAFVDVSDL